ncbi:MAG: hypothetical protein E6G33_14365, partial [Actinobacteria bacterium]
MPVHRVDLLGELHRALQVGEEDGHVLALALEGGAGGADLLGEVFRGIVARIGLAGARARGDGGPAAVAEPPSRARIVTRSRCGELPRHLLGADRGGHLGEQPVRLGELALASRDIAEKACERRPLEVDERQVASGAGVLHQRQLRVQGGLHLSASRVGMDERAAEDDVCLDLVGARPLAPCHCDG